MAFTVVMRNTLQLLTYARDEFLVPLSTVAIHS